MNDTRAFLNKKGQGVAFKEGFDSYFKRKPTPEWNEMVEQGIMETPFLETELPKGSLRGLEEAALLESEKPISMWNRLHLWAEENPIASKIMRADDVARSVYNFEDLVYKYHLFKEYKKRGMSPKEAAKWVKGGMFDWSNRPLIVEKLRFIPFLPSVTYQFARTMGFLFQEKPASMTLKVALTMAAWQLARDGMKKKCGLTDEDEKAMGKQGLRYSQIPLPWTDENGKNYVFDTQAFIPFYDIINLPTADVYAQHPFKKTLLKTLPMSVRPLLSFFNIGAFGEEVYNPDDPLDVNAGKTLRKIFLGLRPGLAGQYWYRWQRNIEKGDELREPFAEKMIIEPLFGNIEHIDFGEKQTREHRRLFFALARMLKDKRSLKLRYNKGYISESKYDKELEILDRRLEMIKKQRKAIFWSE